MTDDFTPPIKTRSTAALLQIVGAPNKWNSKAVQLAHSELMKRNIEPKKIVTTKYLSEKKDRIKNEKMVYKSYHAVILF